MKTINPWIQSISRYTVTIPQGTEHFEAFSEFYTLYPVGSNDFQTIPYVHLSGFSSSDVKGGNNIRGDINLN